MVLYFIGLGLGDAKDISIKALEVVKRAEKVYLESYTSIFESTRKEMVFFYILHFILYCNTIICLGRNIWS